MVIENHDTVSNFNMFRPYVFPLAHLAIISDKILNPKPQAGPYPEGLYTLPLWSLVPKTTIWMGQIPLWLSLSLYIYIYMDPLGACMNPKVLSTHIVECRFLYQDVPLKI